MNKRGRWKHGWKAKPSPAKSRHRPRLRDVRPLLDELLGLDLGSRPGKSLSKMVAGQPTTSINVQRLIRLTEATLDLLEETARHHCHRDPLTLETDSGGIHANANLLLFLSALKRFRVVREAGPLVVGYWIGDADCFE